MSDRKSQSIVRLSKDQGGSSVLLDTRVVICAFNRRQYNFVIRPIPVFFMPRPLTDACAAVLPIVFVAMAFSILSTPPKPAGTRGGCSEHDGRAVRVRRREVFRGSKRKAPPSLPLVPAVHSARVALPPVQNCCVAPNTCSSLPGGWGSSGPAGSRQIGS